ncbi:uncharacterized protein PFL1_02194 [Pseudozyma flocculosa PF-1]|uniref:Related to Aldehyde reductase 1 n=1 Tax=Pseudozyma flocculosa TaxID=84751 RepID=A0A5C3FD86_9BASI|nr:uncharacterized protein PFL1_02194 [Pseudozyma flocculosa PF-1]EPQ30077.1 hypothetical protein PFL1_02194 [Pseudozyma flocculosa PF-1]SPO41421.1 related to Aldehyde reductase 1 [Pseudozyma flocculosa]
MSLKNHQFTLNTGAKMPAIGLGTWLAKPDEVRVAVKTALEQGYRHIDAARVYGNEHEVGQALSESIQAGILKRDDVFITSKLWNTDHAPERVEAGLRRSLRDIGVEYLDLFLVHWPIAFKGTADENVLFPRNDQGQIDVDTSQSIAATWAKMVEMKRKGLVRAIGLSNVSKDMVQAVCDAAQSDDEVPSSVQVEYHPLVAPLQRELKDYCDSKKIILTAYSPLGNNRIGEPLLVQRPTLLDVSAKTGHTPAQILIQWIVRNGVCVIPKSVTPSRLQSNLESLDFDLSDDERNAVDALANDNVVRYNVPIRYAAPNGPWLVDLFGTENEKTDAIWKVATGRVEKI